MRAWFRPFYVWEYCSSSTESHFSRTILRPNIASSLTNFSTLCETVIVVFTQTPFHFTTGTGSLDIWGVKSPSNTVTQVLASAGGKEIIKIHRSDDFQVWDAICWLTESITGTGSVQGGLVWKLKTSELSDCKDSKRLQNLFFEILSYCFWDLTN